MRHKPDRKLSLISIGMLADHGYRTTLNESMWKISKSDMHMGHWVKYNNLYPLMVIGQEGSLDVAEMPKSRLWHMSQTRLWRLMALGYIPDLQHTESHFCEYWRYGNETRSRHSTHYEMVHGLLELIHTHLCGPMPENFLGGARYFIMFVDDTTITAKARRREWNAR